MDFDIEEERSSDINIPSEKTSHVFEKAKAPLLNEAMDESTLKSKICDIKLDNSTYTGHVDSEDKHTRYNTLSDNDVFESSIRSNPVDWHTLKSSGLGDLEKENSTSRKVQRKELLSHVPTETVVMKYGYVSVLHEMATFYYI